MQELLNKGWFEKHRPRVVDDIVFPDEDKEFLIRKYIEQGYIEGNIISYGPGGVGKTTINKVLVAALIKNEADVFVLGRKTEDVDKLSSWLMKAPTSSKQMIVVCEEFDRLSTQALTILKDGYLEKWQPKVAFIATTNNIQKIDSALLQRFNIKMNFSTINPNGLVPKVIKILQAENIEFKQEDVEAFAKQHLTKGFRDIINNLQIASQRGFFNLGALGLGITSSGVEDSIIQIIKYFYTYPTNLDLMNTKALLNPSNTPLNQYYDWLVKILQDDTSINYDYIFSQLSNDPTILLPLKNITVQYFQDLELKKFKHLHLISLITDIFEYWVKVKS